MVTARPHPGDSPSLSQKWLSFDSFDSAYPLAMSTSASGHASKFVGGSGPGSGVAEVEAAGGVEGVFGGAAHGAGGEE